MPSVFSKNAIISGDIDYYCLVCDDILRNEAKANTHLQKAVHKKNLEQSSYATNYGNEGIRKVNKGYYCEYCSILLKTSLKISFHIKQKDHEYNKLDSTVKNLSRVDVERHGNGVILFDDILVTENEWHGLIDNSCAICNVEFDNEQLHKTDSNHILNLIQAPLLIGENKSIYRKIDNHTIHCITCNEVLPLPADTHFEQDSHIEHYLQCHKNNETSKVKTRTEKTKINDIAELKNTAIKSEDGNVKTTGISDLRKLAHKDTYTQKVEPLDALAMQLQLKDYIYKNENGTYMCVLCEWELSNSPGLIKAHIEGRHHQQILKLHKAKVQENKKVKTHIDNTNKNNDSESKPKENSTPLNITTNGITKNNNMATNSINNEKEEILNVVTDLQKQSIDVDFIYEKVLCKKCNKSLSFELKMINDHIDEHKTMKLIEVGGTAIKQTKNMAPESASTSDCNNNANRTNVDSIEVDGTAINQTNNIALEMTSTSDCNNNAHRSDVDSIKVGGTAINQTKNMTPEKVSTSDCNNNANISDVDSETINKYNEKENTTSNISDWAKDDNQSDGTKSYKRPMLMAKVEDREKPSCSSATKIDNTSGGTCNTSNATNADNAKDKPKKSEIIKFASENHINYSYSPYHAYCRVCQTQVPNSFSSLKEHTKGAKHTRNVPTKTTAVSTGRTSADSSKPYKTLRYQIFEDSVHKVETRFNEMIIINEKFFIQIESYHFLTATIRHLRCHLCEINIDRDSINMHLRFSDHMNRLNNTPVIVSESSEFLRIPRDDIFHCGFCNLILPTWDNMQNHLKSGAHKVKKMEAELSLQRILPELERNERRGALMAMIFMRMLFGQLLRH